ncbi:MAG TPA: alcohol dehydrogenase catalytic domain-containing protein [Gaiellaceae bacterium]|nr:alcohol dehydrogenase catalytic domain-containing protein [Gaiellaceae bacterium]
MKALTKLAAGPGNVGLSDREQRSPGPGEVAIAVSGAGVCGTDLHIVDDEFRSVPPVTMGHEVSGIVAEVGHGVTDEWLGARVVSETYFSTCGVCEWCRDGRTNLCPERRSIGSFVDGAFAATVVVPARNLHRVPDGVDEHAAALCEPLACVCQCLCDPPAVTAGDDVLVTGPGPVGLLAAQVARALGGSVVVTGLARDEVRLAAARALEFETATAEELDADGRFHVVIECSGSQSGASACLQGARRGGRYVQIGVFGRPVTVRLDAVFEKELVVTSGYASTPRSWRRALSLLEERRVQLKPLVSEVVPLDAWERVFADLREGKAVKYVFDPRL